MKVLRAAAKDVRYLVDRGFPKEPAVRFVGDHYRLPEDQRFVLARVVVAAEMARLRREKTMSLEELRGGALFIDGYNVLITVESVLARRPVFICDDGFIRDAQGVFRSYKTSDFTANALDAITNLLADMGLSRAEVLLDQQIGRSGELAASIREIIAERGVPGTAKTAKNVDSQLKDPRMIVASADGNIIDAAMGAVDIPGEICRCMGKLPLIL